MKTFNSTLAIVAIALTSVFGFTSCDKNDEAFDNAPVAKQNNQLPVNTTDNTTDTTPKDTVISISDSAEGFAENLKQMYNFDFIGSWEYVSADGKTFVLNVKEETKKSSDYRYYTATLTIDGVEYEGEMNTMAFTTAAKASNNRARLCGVSFTDNANKSTDSELVTCLTYDRKLIDRAATFKKVSATTSEARRRWGGYVR